MFQSLPQGIKISITRSIKTSFENYMRSIQWNEDKYNFENFIMEWQAYSKNNTSWIHKLEENILTNPSFHEELTKKINETIEKVFTTEPTKEQIEKIDSYVKMLNIEDIDFCCKSEAEYVIDKLEGKLEKKNDVNEQASEKQLKIAAILYYQAYEKDLPNKNYTCSEIEKVIKKAQTTLKHNTHGDIEDSFTLPLQ